MYLAGDSQPQGAGPKRLGKKPVIHVDQEREYFHNMKLRFVNLFEDLFKRFLPSALVVCAEQIDYKLFFCHLQGLRAPLAYRAVIFKSKCQELGGLPSSIPMLQSLPFISSQKGRPRSGKGMHLTAQTKGMHLTAQTGCQL